MHRQIDATLGKCFLDFLGEHALGADLGERYFLQPVAGRLDDFDFHRVTARAQERGNVVGLPERELRATTADAQFHLPPTALGSFWLRLSALLFSSAVKVEGSD